MPNFIVINSKDTVFNSEAHTVLESHRFTKLHEGTYIGSSGVSNVAAKLKNLESYKNKKASSDIKIYYGSLQS